MAALDTKENQAKEQAKSEVINLKEQLSQIEAKLQKLLDVYLEDALTQKEYAAKKNMFVSQKVALNEKITDFEQKGLSWLEPAREFILSLNQATKLIEENNLSEMTTFLKNIGSNHILRNRQFVFAPKIQYEMTAERSEAASSGLPFSKVCPWKESNPHYGFRKPASYPLNDRDKRLNTKSAHNSLGKRLIVFYFGEIIMQERFDSGNIFVFYV